MKKAFQIAYAAVFLAVCALPLALKPFTGKNADLEKKAEEEQLPSFLREDGGINNDFSTEFESYANEQLPLRAELLTAAGFVKGELLHSPSSNVICGKDGWLFFRDEQADFMDTNAMTDRELRAAAVTLSLIQERVTAEGGRFTFVPMPNKSSVYPEQMPACYRHAAENNLTRLSAVLREYGVNYTDMLSVMTAQKDMGLYHRRDTHWNYLGALIGYNAIMDALGLPHETYDGVNYTYDQTWDGDLEKLLYPAGGFKDYQYQFDIAYQPYRFLNPRGVKDQEAQMAEFMSDRERGDMNIALENRGNPANGKLYMVRDSFGRALLPLMTDNFKSAEFVRTNRPDLSRASGGANMVYEIVERNLRNVTETAPFMTAPQRTEDAVRGASPADGTAKAVCENKGFAVQICGTLPADSEPGDGRVYLVLKNETGTQVFEAFPIYEAEQLGEGEHPGFSAFLDPQLGLAGDYELTIVTGGRAYSAAPIRILQE